MEWFIFALLAPMLWGILNVIDRYFLTKLIKNPVSYQILCLLSDTLVIIPIFVFTKISFAFPWFILSILLSVIISLIFIYYNKALMIEETSRVVILFYLNPLFALILAYVFLGETLNLGKYIGILFLVLSAILISYKKSKGKFKFSAALGYVLIISISWAASNVFTKYVFNFIDYFSFLFATVVGYFICGLILLCIPKFRKDFFNDMHKANKKKVFSWRIFSVILYYIALISFYIAISKESISLVSAIPSLQPLFVLIYTIILSFFIPKVLKEEISKTIILIKILSIILIFIGTWLVVS